MLTPLANVLLDQPVDQAARALLGQRLIRRLGDVIIGGRITEVEAYGGADDSCSHAFRGPTPRTRPMFGPTGRAYVYLIYGVHSCLNVVAHAPDRVGAILIRALAPEIGIDQMQMARPRSSVRDLARGPGRLCRALSIDRSFNDYDLLDPDGPLFLAAGTPLAPDQLGVSARIGVVGSEDDKRRPWRFFELGQTAVSKHPSGYSGSG